VLYAPLAQESGQRRLFGEVEVPVIHHMGQLLEYLGITKRRFEPCFGSRPGELVIEGMGIDLVTEPRHCLCMSKETALSLAENIGQVLGSVSEKRYGSAMSRLEEMIRAIAKVAIPIRDEITIKISYPGQGQGGVTDAQLECHFTVREHSICAEYAQLALPADSENEAALRDVAVLLQSHCNNLMRDDPRAALNDLHSAMLVLAELAGVKGGTIIRVLD
jgi:hypothetical protein